MLLLGMDMETIMKLEKQNCGNCEFYNPDCKWCDKRGAAHVNAHIRHGKPTKEYPCNSRVLSQQDGKECREHSCRINGRWVAMPNAEHHPRAVASRAPCSCWASSSEGETT